MTHRGTLRTENKTEKNDLRTWIEIDREAIDQNYRTFRSLTPRTCALMAVVKSNAYGHGLVDFSREVARLGADWLGVDSIVEGLALRREGISTPILVLGHTLDGRIDDAREHNISITVSDMVALKEIAALPIDKRPNIHIKVDTGMHRQGFLIEELASVMRIVAGGKNTVAVEGLYTHFAAAKNPSFPAYTAAQIAEFKGWITEFKRLGLLPVTHAAATSGTILFPESHFDMVRVGIGLYGLWPSKEVEAFAHSKMSLKPALSWKSVIGEIKELEEGVQVGYDLTETLPRATKTAVVPIGYWHGYSRAFSSVGTMLVRGARARVLGRVSMDMVVLDVTDIPKAAVGDEVVIIGQQGDEYVGADDLARMSDTVNYEVVTQINPLIKRRYGLSE